MVTTCKITNQMIMQGVFPIVLFLHEHMPSKVNLKISQFRKMNNWYADALVKWLYDGFDIICVKEI